MPVALLDVNVLFALAWEKHQHHHAAHRWFNSHSMNGWATSPITECGFVRLSANPKAAYVEITVFEAAQVLSRLTSHANHVFWHDDMRVQDAMHAFSPTQLRGHLQITDAYLISVAIANGGRLATFDRRAASLTAAKYSEAVEVISGLE